MVKKLYEALKRKIKKKTGIKNGIKSQLLPLSMQLVQEEAALKEGIKEVNNNRRLITFAQEEVTHHMLHFLQVDGLEKDKKLVRWSCMLYRFFHLLLLFYEVLL